MLAETFISIAQPIIVATGLDHVLTNPLPDISRTGLIHAIMKKQAHDWMVRIMGTKKIQ